MHGAYGYVSPAVRQTSRPSRRSAWKPLLRERARISPSSIAPVLDALLAAQRAIPAESGVDLAPERALGKKYPTTGHLMSRERETLTSDFGSRTMGMPLTVSVKAPARP